jgi:iron complex transport system substrate-binding protein
MFDKRILIALVSVVFLTAGNPVVSKAGEAAGAKRIVSLAPSITEELYLLGSQDRLLGVTTYCQKPPQAAEKEKVGSAVEADVEKIAAIKPDIVFATSMINPKDIEKLKHLGIRVVVFGAAENFEQLCAQFLDLAGYAGEEEKARMILSQVRSRIKAVSDSVSTFPRPKVIVQAGAKPLWVAGSDSLINDIIVTAGGENIGPEGKNGSFSRENVLELDPDVIIITTMGIVGEEEENLWRKYPGISAVKNNRIYIVDSYRFCSPTPVSFAEGVEETAAILHPGR